MKQFTDGHVFLQGKYMGCTLEDILNEDPGYIIWVYSNVSSHGGIPPSVFQEAQDLMDRGEDEYLQELDFHAE